MSKSFNKEFFNAFKLIFLKNTKYQYETASQTIIANGFIFMLGAYTHYVYTMGTSTSDKLKFVKKYKMIRNGFTEFMVIDEKGNHYNVNNSFWYGKWDSIEHWSNIKEGDELYVKYYGWRAPFLGLFPNIYFTTPAFNRDTRF
jgi:hypothetical protein